MNEKYIRNILKRLTCSKGKREEIGKELKSELETRIESGKKEEDVIREMGTPSEIAEEFNRNFPEEEVKKYRREKLKRHLIIAVIIIAALAALVYWILPKSTEIGKSGVFQAEKVEETAKTVINVFNEEDYGTMQQMSAEKLKDSLTKEGMNEAKNSFGSDWGDFQSFGNIYMAESTQYGKKSAIAQVNAAYENVSITFTLIFDKDMKLTGFWMK